MSKDLDLFSILNNISKEKNSIAEEEGFDKVYNPFMIRTSNFHVHFKNLSCNRLSHK